MILPLPNPQFLEELLSRIDAAKKSVVVVNYLAELSEFAKKTDPVLKIVAALVRAHRRGVSVTVLLEGLKFENNYPFYRMLKKAGADVWMDTSLTFIHHKVVVIDDEMMIVGSHNLTRAALTDHEEYSIITDDAGVICRFALEACKITRQREVVRAGVCKDVVQLPRGFLAFVAKPLFKAHAENACDLYMMFCANGVKNGTQIAIANEEWSKILGFDRIRARPNVTKAYSKHYCEQRINRILYQLKKLKLISIDRSNDTISLHYPKVPKSEAGLPIPKTYWSYDWPRRLSFAAKYFFMVTLSELSESYYYPWWSNSLKKIVEKHGCDSAGLGRAIRELENYNVLEVLRSVATKYKGAYSEEAQYYRLNPFYDMAEFESEILKLEQRYPSASVKLGIRIAASFWKSHDIEKIDAICNIIKKHGRKRALSALKRITALPNFSALKSFSYFITLV